MGNGPSAASRSCCRRRQPALLVVKTEDCDHWELLRARAFEESRKLLVRGLTRLAAKRNTWNRLGNHLKDLKQFGDYSRRANVPRRRWHILGENLKMFKRRRQQVQEWNGFVYRFQSLGPISMGRGFEPWHRLGVEPSVWKIKPLGRCGF